MGVVAADLQPAGSTSQIAVSVKDVGMVFGNVHAVRNASFDLPKGRFLTILGPSGSGKTTLLRMIAGFDRPTSGEIFINGQPVSAVPPYKRAIGMVFQKLALFPHMTAAENVAFPLKMRRHDARTIPAKVERYLDLVRLGGYGQRRINELSGGQQQRVAIARALVFEPDLLLLDEPFAALDAFTRRSMQNELITLWQARRPTVVFVTHDVEEAVLLGEHVVELDRGRLVGRQEIAIPYPRDPTDPAVNGYRRRILAGLLAPSPSPHPVPVLEK